MFIGCSLEKDRTIEILKKSKYSEAYSLFHDTGDSDEWENTHKRLREFEITPIKLINSSKKKTGEVYKEQLPLIFSRIIREVKKEYTEVHNNAVRNIFNFDLPSVTTDYAYSLTSTQFM